MTQAAGERLDRAQRSSAGDVTRMVFDLVVPLALFYGLRAAGVGMYVALLVGALASGATAVVVVSTRRRLDGFAAFVLCTMALSVGVSLLTGSPRFLLAKEAWLTGFAGLWFLGTLWSRRPRTFQIAAPLLEGRMGWPSGWDALWRRAPAFRRMWRISTVLWGVGILLDAGARVVMAYTLPVDVVPALNTVLYSLTCVVLILVTNIHYRAAGVYDRTSALYRPGRSEEKHHA